MASRTLQQPGQLGLIRPDSDWMRPRELPDLRGRPLVALDTENKDIGLDQNIGPGWAFGRDGGYLLGVSWSAEGTRGYAPIRHPESDNFALENVVRWVDDLCRSGTRIVFHNGPYDVGWFGTYGVAPPPSMEDTLAGCVMLDENERSYSLDACCARAGVPGKDEALLADAVEAYGGSRRNPRASLWRVPAQFAGPYAEQDAEATRHLWQQTEAALRAQDVWEAYRTEIELIPMVVAMRRRGIRVDTSMLEQLAAEFRVSSRKWLADVGELLGLGRAATMEEIRSSRQMEYWFTREKISYPKTTKTGQGSFTIDWMARHEHPLPRACTMAAKFEEAASKFVDNFLLGFQRRGRVHAEIHQFKSDTGGTRSHRFSYSEPPLQQMYSPDKDPRNDKKELIWDTAIGTRLRMAFLPEEGEAWCAPDYSQQEPRLTVHYASVCHARGADEAVRRYIENPRTDYHQMVADMTGRPRPIAKILNLAMTYGKGKRSLAEELGVSLEEAEAILRDYHERLPFIKSLEDICKTRAQRGFIKLIDGARIHYPQWEGGWIDWDVRQDAVMRGKKLEPCDWDEAMRRRADPEHPWSRTRLRRADTRKSLNNLIQGSAARQTKRAMLAMWREGILPLIQMHDEVGFSTGSRRQAERSAEIMIATTPLVVPTVVDLELGQNWGTAKMKLDAYEAKYGLAA